MKWPKRSWWIAEEAEIRSVQAARGWVHRTPRKARKSAVRGFWKGEFRGQRVFDSNFGESQPIDTMSVYFAPSMPGRCGRVDMLLARERF